MDKLISEAVKEIGTDRLNAKDLFRKLSAHQRMSISNMAVHNYKVAKKIILEHFERGLVLIPKYKLAYNHVTYEFDEQVLEIVLSMLRNDGFYIDTTTYTSEEGTPNTDYIIAWDERIYIKK